MSPHTKGSSKLWCIWDTRNRMKPGSASIQHETSAWKASSRRIRGRRAAAIAVGGEHRSWEVIPGCTIPCVSIFANTSYTFPYLSKQKRTIQWFKYPQKALETLSYPTPKKDPQREMTSELVIQKTCGPWKPPAVAPDCPSQKSCNGHGPQKRELKELQDGPNRRNKMQQTQCFCK